MNRWIDFGGWKMMMVGYPRSSSPYPGKSELQQSKRIGFSLVFNETMVTKKALIRKGFTIKQKLNEKKHKKIKLRGFS